MAEIRLRQDNLEAARESLRGYTMTEDSYCADVLARVELESARRAAREGRMQIVRDRVRRAKEIVDLALQRFPDNVALQQTKSNIERFELEFP